MNDKKELKILNRTIKIDVLNDEMTLEADTKLVENAWESMMLNGAKGVDSARVRRNEEQSAQIENSEKLTSVESTLYRSLVMELAYVAQDRVEIAAAVKCLTRHMMEPREWTHARTRKVGSIPGEEQEVRVDVLHDKRQVKRCRCMWPLIGLEICFGERARQA